MELCGAEELDIYNIYKEYQQTYSLRMCVPLRDYL